MLLEFSNFFQCHQSTSRFLIQKILLCHCKQFYSLPYQKLDGSDSPLQESRITKHCTANDRQYFDQIRNSLFFLVIIDQAASKKDTLKKSCYDAEEQCESSTSQSNITTTQRQPGTTIALTLPNLQGYLPNADLDKTVDANTHLQEFCQANNNTLN